LEVSKFLNEDAFLMNVLGIKPTAKKYGIQPCQIQNWQNNANALMELPA
jgi:hypothetical protein